MPHFQHIFRYDTPRDAHVFGVCAVIEQKVFAEIFLPAAAMIAAETRRGVRGNYTNASAPACINALADSDNFADDFMTEDRGRTNHFGVIAAPPNFQVGAIVQGETDAQ